jgi:hypothetical protein
MNFIGAIFMTVLGIGGFLKPLMVAKLVGLTPSEPHGISEIRATLGGFFIGLGDFAVYSLGFYALFGRKMLCLLIIALPAIVLIPRRSITANI